MPIPLWCLLGFAVWTLLLLLPVMLTRTFKVLSGQSKANEFPADLPHGSDAYRRATRAHLNSVENLPVFASVVLVAAVSSIQSPLLDVAAIVVLGGRIVQSTTHLISISPAAVTIRYTFFVVQYAAIVTMAFEIARRAAGR